MEVLDGHCRAAGRDPKAIVKTRLGSLVIRKTQAEAERVVEGILQRPGIDRERIRNMFIAGDPDHVTRKAQALLDAGLDGLIFNMPHMEDPEMIELAGRTLSGRLEPART
jgi:alkanesulfonate monooxygenase SsuD/methylene tetrahydromethanopterin reductase-like flavin-dependent oxidoreductase (luciferase family)